MTRWLLLVIKFFLVCRNQARKILFEFHRDIEIHRMPCLSKKYGKLNAITGFPFFLIHSGYAIFIRFPPKKTN